jgi:hypothetical protein
MSRWLSVRWALTAALGIGVASVFAWGQDSDSPGLSLGDVARQTRSRTDTKGQPSEAQQLVDEMQREQEEAANAPTGFKSYDAGDYRLFVPFPYSLEGRENGGAVLLGSRLGVTNTEVMAGAPISFPAGVTPGVLSDVNILNLVRQLAALHGQSPYCSAMKLGERKAFRCAWSTSPRLLGQEVWGTMVFVVASNSVIPVMCVSPDDSVHQQCVVYDTWGRNTCSDRYRAWPDVQKTIEARYREETTTVQACDQIIYPSIRLKEDVVVHPVTIAEAKPSKTVSGTVPQDTSVVAGTPSESLAELARQTRQAPHRQSQTKLDNAEGEIVAPVGFQSFTIQYCLNPQQCSEAKVVIPEKAEVVSRVNGQYILKSMLNGGAVILYVGPADVNSPYRSMTDPDYIRMRDLANSNGWTREKTDGVSTQELTIAGRQAVMTRFRYQRDQKTWWIGERALIEMPGAQFLVGCTAAEQNFAEAEALCTTLVNSLRLP